MARKPKATGDPKPAKRKMTQEEHSALFIKTARNWALARRRRNLSVRSRKWPEAATESAGPVSV